MSVLATQLTEEVLRAGVGGNEIVTQLAAEVLRVMNPRNARPTQLTSEVLREAGTANVAYMTQLTEEVVRLGLCNADITQLTEEVLRINLILVGDLIFDETFDILKAACTAQTANITLGVRSLLFWQYPRRLFSRKICRFYYEGTDGRCASASAEGTCAHTMRQCIDRSNETRFGGFPGIPGGYFDA